MGKKASIIIIAGLMILSTCIKQINAQTERSCGIITQIWHNTKPLKQNEESKLLDIQRKGKPTKAKIGMPILKDDRIQAKETYVEFEITWHREKQIGESEEKDDRIIFKASENKPIHVIIEECPEKTILSCFSDIITIIKSGKPFEIKTEPAIAGAPGTNFEIKQVNKGQETRLIVTQGEAYLKNKYGSISVREFEMGIARKDKPPTKIKIDKNLIGKEIGWLFQRTGLPDVYLKEFEKFLRPG